MTSLQKGLVAHWTMDDADTSGGTLYDSSAYNNHSTLDGSLNTVTGYVNETALAFDGSGTVDGTVEGDNIEVPESVTRTDNYPNGVTYSIWLNVDTDAVDRMSLFRGGSTIRHIEILSQSQNFRTEAAQENGYSFGSGTFPDNVRGEWSHFAIVFANDEPNRPVRWYQNGELFHTGDMTSGTNPDTEYFSFGSIGRSTGNTDFTYAKSFDGKIEDVRIYNYALTESRIKQLSQMRSQRQIESNLQKGLVGHWTMDDADTSGGTLYDSSGYDNNGSIGNGTTTSQSGKVNESYAFDGSGGAVDADDTTTDLTGDLSFSFWVKANDPGLQRETIINKAYGGVLTVNIEDGSEPYRIQVYHGDSGSDSQNYESNTWSVINTGEWAHIAFSRDIDLMEEKLWKNGSLVSTDSISITPVQGSNPISIGTGYTNTLTGNMDDVRIYKKTLSENEVKRLYNKR